MSLQKVEEKANECFIQPDGRDYRGDVSKTYFYINCQKWSSQSPHKHKYTVKKFDQFLEAGLGDHNYCRNPNFDPAGPWCYTTNEEVERDYCNVHMCESECYEAEYGEDYRGTVSTGLGGRVCQHWDSQYPHEHAYDSPIFGNADIRGHNYCRNPDHDPSGPWCFNNDPNDMVEYYFYCDISTCKSEKAQMQYSECYISEFGDEYRGTVSETTFGVPCQKWSWQHPHTHDISTFLRGIGDHNYCRNPNQRMGGPWCYTKSTRVSWTYCNVNRCNQNKKNLTVETPEELEGCYVGGESADYRGFVSVTVSGIPCQKWTSQSPHYHKFYPEHYAYSGIGDHNYCRNPDNGEGGPWCITTSTDPSWDYCDIPTIEMSPKWFISGCNITINSTHSGNALDEYCDGMSTLCLQPDSNYSLASNLTSHHGVCCCHDTLCNRPKFNVIVGCYLDGNSQSYRGTVSVAYTNQECLKWTQIAFWTGEFYYYYGEDFFPGSGLGDHNYCRSPHPELFEPSFKNRVWCFTSKVQDGRYIRQFCDIPVCKWRTCYNCIQNDTMNTCTEDSKQRCSGTCYTFQISSTWYIRGCDTDLDRPCTDGPANLSTSCILDNNLPNEPRLNTTGNSSSYSNYSTPLHSGVATARECCCRTDQCNKPDLFYSPSTESTTFSTMSTDKPVSTARSTTMQTVVATSPSSRGTVIEVAGTLLGIVASFFIAQCML
ncbi:plasminogen-like [Amphiura filiformis]|uniref:plasminogen-like n=1 Tax=Amphiura filiformis TaxID=82378 RepID=UPI003B2267AB